MRNEINAVDLAFVVDTTSIQHLASLLKMEFAELELDRKVLDLQRMDSELSIDEMADFVETSRYAVSTSLVRLLSRDLIEVPALS